MKNQGKQRKPIKIREHLEKHVLPIFSLVFCNLTPRVTRHPVWTKPVGLSLLGFPNLFLQEKWGQENRQETARKNHGSPKESLGKTRKS